MSGPPAGRVSASVLALLAIANLAIPDIPGFPVDPTLVLAVSAAALALSAWWQDRLYLGWQHAAAALLLASFAWGFYAADGAYSDEKIPAMLFGIMGGIFAIQLLRTADQRRAFIATIGLAGVVSAVLLAGVGGTAPVGGRMTLFGLSPISVGFMCSTGALLSFVAAAEVGAIRIKAVLYLILAAACSYQAATTGSRGPLLAAVIAGAVALLFGHGRGKLRTTVALGVIAVAGLRLIQGSTSDSAARLATTESSGRTDLWRRTIEAIVEHPWGTGWGDMTERVAVPMVFYTSAGDRQYAHNVVLEAGVEGGWLALVGLSAAIVLSFVLFRRGASDSPVDRAMLAVLVFATVNALVSSDLGGTRLLWVMFGASLATTMGDRVRSAPIGRSRRLESHPKAFGQAIPH